jgi:hypothetical protein
MTPILFFVSLGVIATLVVLGMGGYSMARGGRYDDKHGFPLMEARVMIQAVTVLLVIIATLFWA